MYKYTMFLLMLVFSLVVVSDAGCNTAGCCNCSRQKNGSCAQVGVKVCTSGKTRNKNALISNI